MLRKQPKTQVISLGFNVLVSEYRGYGYSEGEAGSPNQELEAYLDAEAALKFVLDRGCDRNKIIAHGTSLGGAYATALGYFFDIGTVILDHSFTTPSAAGASFSRVISEKTCEEAFIQAYSHGQIESSPGIGRRALITDRFNSLQKMKDAENTDLFVIQGENDRLTPKRFGPRFMQEKYPENRGLREGRLAIVEGGHSQWEFFRNTPTAARAQEQLRNFLAQKNLIAETSSQSFIYTIVDLIDELNSFQF